MIQRYPRISNILYVILAEFTIYSTIDSNYKFLIQQFSFYTPTTSNRFTFHVENQEKLNYLTLKRYAFLRSRHSPFHFSGIYSQAVDDIFTGMKAELLFITETRNDSSRTKSKRIKMSLADAKSGSSFEETADRI